MAHECPECGQVCYCGGDIDDLLLNGTDEEEMCDHCDGEDDFDDLLLDDEEESDGG